jgi:lysozyme family protein
MMDYEERDNWTGLSRNEKVWWGMEVLPEYMPLLDEIVDGILDDRSRYEEVEAMRDNGVPWFFVAAIHERESSRDFSRHLHEGSPLTGRTVNVPSGRPRGGEPPFTWEESAEDALYFLKDLENKVSDWQRDVGGAVEHLERYNGLGYRDYHADEVCVSPYLSSMSNLYWRGKYVADGRFDPEAVDAQPGVLALVKHMVASGVVEWPLRGDPPTG